MEKQQPSLAETFNGLFGQPRPQLPATSSPDLPPAAPPFLPYQPPTSPPPAPQLDEEKLSFPRRLAGSLLDFGLFFGLCLTLAARGWTLPQVAAGSPATALILFVTVTYGLVYIITKSSVALPFSQLAGKLPIVGPGLYGKDAAGKEDGLLACPLCTGMWAGTILAALGVSTFPLAPGLAGARDLVVHGLLGAGSAYFLHAVTDRVQRD